MNDVKIQNRNERSKSNIETRKWSGKHPGNGPCRHGRCEKERERRIKEE